uniref:Uncharacterized protein n=1 Tax=Porphyridium purpureum TaxID=35688 RepID=W0RZ36_PORPP|nr:hypothetical protein Y721_p096 [Porphyridium purpureum]ATJ02933.1 hypothetical protein [Porphyridium purpureum]BAO23712.1 hypothetical protein [Porphyridium purpureum]
MIKNRLIAYLFANSHSKIVTPIKNGTRYFMPLDVILYDRQKIIVDITIREINQYLCMIKQT